MSWVKVIFWVICLSPIWGVVVWEVWQVFIRPALITRSDINTEVDRLMVREDGQGFEVACREEHAAWYRSESFEQGRWRRIRKEIMRRERKLGVNFRKVLR